jgi:hypothetical protein
MDREEVGVAVGGTAVGVAVGVLRGDTVLVGVAVGKGIGVLVGVGVQVGVVVGMGLGVSVGVATASLVGVCVAVAGSVCAVEVGTTVHVAVGVGVARCIRTVGTKPWVGVGETEGEREHAPATSSTVMNSIHRPCPDTILEISCPFICGLPVRTSHPCAWPIIPWVDAHPQIGLGKINLRSTVYWTKENTTRKRTIWQADEWLQPQKPVVGSKSTIKRGPG